MFCGRPVRILLVKREPFHEGDQSRVHLQRFNVLGIGALPVIPDISEHSVLPVRDGAQCFVVALGAHVEGLQLDTFGPHLLELGPLLVEQGLVAGDGGSILGILSFKLGKVLLLLLLILRTPC